MTDIKNKRTIEFFGGINQNVLQHAQQHILLLHAKTSQRCISVSRSTLVCAYVTWQENELRFVIILFRTKYPELSGNTHTLRQRELYRPGEESTYPGIKFLLLLLGKCLQIKIRTTLLELQTVHAFGQSIT